MADGKELTLLHVASFIEIDALKEFLYQNNIASIEKDNFKSSMMAGWVSPGSHQNIELFVRKIDFLQAKHLLEKFLEEQNKAN
ncbi:MAG: DUF2007 domain-containing protein [Bacteroidales bacterium]|nr:DUF2007 domain-containing protein [Bacteroidales bacterium]